MTGQADILNRAAVAAQAGTRKIPGNPNVGLAGWALDSAPRIKYGVTPCRARGRLFLRGNDGHGRGNDEKRQQTPIIRNQASTEASPGQSYINGFSTVIPAKAGIQWPKSSVSLRKCSLCRCLDSGESRSDGVGISYAIALEASPEAAPAATPETTSLVSSTFPDGPRRRPAGMLRRKYESIRAGTKNVAGAPTRATIRRTKKLGSSVG